MMTCEAQERGIQLMSSVPQIEGSSIAAEEFSTWDIDPAHSAAEFKVRRLMFSDAKGRFSGLSGVLKLDESDYAHSTVEVSFPAASITLADDRLDAHLKSENFFNVGKFPTVTFRSTSIRYTGNQDFAVAGELTVGGVTRAVTLTVHEVSEPARDAWGNVRIGLSSSAKINRKDFDLVWNERLAYDGLVADEVTITMNVYQSMNDGQETLLAALQRHGRRRPISLGNTPDRVASAICWKTSSSSKSPEEIGCAREASCLSD